MCAIQQLCDVSRMSDIWCKSKKKKKCAQTTTMRALVHRDSRIDLAFSLLSHKAISLRPLNPNGWLYSPFLPPQHQAQAISHNIRDDTAQDIDNSGEIFWLNAIFTGWNAFWSMDIALPYKNSDFLFLSHFISSFFLLTLLNFLLMLSLSVSNLKPVGFFAYSSGMSKIRGVISWRETSEFISSQTDLPVVFKQSWRQAIFLRHFRLLIDMNSTE